MTNRDSVIRVRVTKSEKEEIRDYIENEVHFSGFSDFFRTRAFDEIRHSERPENESENLDTEQIESVIESSVSNMSTSVESVETKVSQVLSIVEEMQGDISSLATDLYDLLPTESYLSENHETHRKLCAEPYSVTRNDDVETLRLLSTPRAWAIHMGERESRVETALYSLTRDMPDVKSKTVRVPRGDEEIEVYYKED